MWDRSRHISSRMQTDLGWQRSVISTRGSRIRIAPSVRRFVQALAVLPTSGNPHNQLAVLATYTDAECVSVYRYCRSLMIENPFQTAHENLTLLFEKNKQKGFGLSSGIQGSTDGKDANGPGGGGGGSRDIGASVGGMSGLSGSGAPHHGKGKGKGSGG